MPSFRHSCASPQLYFTHLDEIHTSLSCVNTLNKAAAARDHSENRLSDKNLCDCDWVLHRDCKSVLACGHRLVEFWLPGTGCSHMAAHLRQPEEQSVPRCLHTEGLRASDTSAHTFCKGPRLRKINPPRIERIERIERPCRACAGVLGERGCRIGCSFSLGRRC